MLPTFRNDAEADAALEEARARWDDGADAVWEAITWAIVRELTIGTAISESGRLRVYTVHGARSIGWPTVTVLYEIESDGLFTIKEARFEQAKAFQAGRA